MADGDLFVLENVYPDAVSIFTSTPVPLLTAKEDAIVVLDTNTLLVPYGAGSEALHAIESTYRTLIQANRLRVPARVAREFAKNRGVKIAELYQKLKRRRDTQRERLGAHPILQGIKAYQDVTKLDAELAERSKAYGDALGALLNEIQSWAWDDPVTALYRKLFTSPSIIVEMKKAQATTAAEHADRFETRRPPGYEDKHKRDQGIGDLIIWFTILEIAATEKKHVIFVSGEEKSDWWLTSEKEMIAPRFELVDEFRRSSGGRSFHIIKLSHLLELFGADKSVLASIRDEEKQASLEETAISPPSSPIDWAACLENAKQEVHRAEEAIRSLPAEAANDGPHLPLGRAFHMSRARLAAALRELDALQAASRADIGRRRFSGAICPRCKQPAMGIGKWSNVCLKCDYTETD